MFDTSCAQHLLQSSRQQCRVSHGCAVCECKQEADQGSHQPVRPLLQQQLSAQHASCILRCNCCRWQLLQLSLFCSVGQPRLQLEQQLPCVRGLQACCQAPCAGLDLGAIVSVE
jgi:hypothetical protein